MMTETTPLESLLRRDRLIVGTSLFLITVLAWLYLLCGAGMQMSPFDMTTFSLVPHQAAGTPMHMPEMGMVAGEWSLEQTIIVLLMWWIMMIAMMMPSAAPMVLLYARVVRHAQKNNQTSNPAIHAMAFVIGYLFIWLIFSIFITATQWRIELNNWLSMKLISVNGWLSGGLLISVGIYQLTPLKLACLKHCRSPAEFIATHMKTGRLGAYQMGIEHGLFCLGCCWLLMTLLFVGGVMNILWIAILTLFVLAEKIIPGGQLLSRSTGIILIIWGTVILFTVIQ